MHFVSHKVIHTYRFVRQNIHVNVHDYARCCEKVCTHAKNNASKRKKKNQQIQTERCNNADESKQKVCFFLRMLVRMVLKFVGRYVNISIYQSFRQSTFTFTALKPHISINYCGWTYILCAEWGSVFNGTSMKLIY